MTPSTPFLARAGSDPSQRWGLLALAWLLLSITLSMQWWVGDRTLYAQSLEDKREALHVGILHNVPPEGKSWSDWGAYSVQRRVGVVYAAEGVHQLTGLRVGKIYKAFDTAFLFLSLLAMWAYLKRQIGSPWALVGTFYVIAVLPMTYLFAMFHPWDRLQLLIWIGLLALMQRRVVAGLAPLLVLSVVVKPDTIFLPFLYLALHAVDTNRRRLAAEFLVLLALTWGAYFALGAWFPDPHGAAKSTGGVLAQIQSNLADFKAMNFRYPPLVVHALPFALAAVGWRSGSHRQRMHLLFALGMAGIFFAFSNFVEVRAHLMLLVLVLPAALQTVQAWMRSPDAGTAPCA